MANVLEFIEGGESSGSQAATEELMKYEKKKKAKMFLNLLQSKSFVKGNWATKE